MKFVKIILGLVAAGVLLAGGFMAGTFITQTRTAEYPRCNNLPSRLYSATTNSTHNSSSTAISTHDSSTTTPGNTRPAVHAACHSTAGTMGTEAWWMMNPQGEWEHGWMMQPKLRAARSTRLGNARWGL